MVKASLISHGTVAQNRKARHDYAIEDTIEAGIVLTGSEVKSLRKGRCTLTEAFAQPEGDEFFLVNCHIPPGSCCSIARRWRGCTARSAARA